MQIRQWSRFYLNIHSNSQNRIALIAQKARVQHNFMKPTRLLFYLLLIICALNTTHSAVYNQCILFINNDFHANSYQLKLTLTIYFSAIFLCRCFLSVLADKHSAKKCILIAIGIAILGHGLASCATNIYVFIVARFLQGLGLGGGQVMGLVILMQCFSDKGRASIIASEQVLFSIASICLPLMGHYVSMGLSWRYVFLFYFFISTCAIFYLFFGQTSTPAQISTPINSAQTQNTKHLLSNKQFIIPTIMSCFSFSGYILWGGYFGLFIHHYGIPLKYLLVYQLIPIVPYFICSMLFKKLTKKIDKITLYKRILSLQISALTMIILLIFWNKTSYSFKLGLLIPIILHNLAGSFFRPLMQEQALNAVPYNRIGFTSSFISICQVGFNAVFAIILNCTTALMETFVCIQLFLSINIIAYLIHIRRNLLQAKLAN